MRLLRFGQCERAFFFLLRNRRFPFTVSAGKEFFLSVDLRQVVSHMHIGAVRLLFAQFGVVGKRTSITSSTLRLRDSSVTGAATSTAFGVAGHKVGGRDVNLLAVAQAKHQNSGVFQIAADDAEDADIFGKARHLRFKAANAGTTIVMFTPPATLR